MATTDQCPSWCVRENRDGLEDHISETVTRNSFKFELLRYFGDDITYVTLMTAMDGGDAITMPVDTVVSLVDEVRQLVAEAPQMV